MHWNDLVHWTLGARLEWAGEHGLDSRHRRRLRRSRTSAPTASEVAEFIETVEAFNRAHRPGQTPQPRATAHSAIATACSSANPIDWVITAVEFRLPRNRALKMDYAGVPEELAAMGIDDADAPCIVAEAISRIRTRKLPNPALLGNAGSFFKNPVLAAMPWPTRCKRTTPACRSSSGHRRPPQAVGGLADRTGRLEGLSRRRRRRRRHSTPWCWSITASATGAATARGRATQSSLRCANASASRWNRSRASSAPLLRLPTKHQHARIAARPRAAC